jgi:hypothetical protein
LTEYQQIIFLYLNFAKNWGWTFSQTDEQYVEDVFDALIVASLASEDAEQAVYCDEI